MISFILTILISVCYLILIVIIDTYNKSVNSDEDCKDDMVGLVCMDVRKLDEKNSKSDLAPIHVALSRGCRSIARKLIELGASVNCQTSQRKNTPLHYAANNGNPNPYDSLADLEVEDNRVIGTDFIELLLSRGADPNLRNFSGSTPLHIAVTGSNVECYVNIMLILVEGGAYVDLRNNDGETPLSLAISYMNKDCVEKLLYYGANINDAITDESQNTLESFGEFTIQYIIKLQAADLPLNEYWDFAICDDYQTFYHECSMEVDALKSNFVDRYTSLYDLLHMHPNERCKYINNEKYKNLCLRPDLEEQFPMYAIVIVGSYREAMTRKALFQPARVALSEITKFSIPDSCVEHLCKYLSNADMLSLIVSHENSSDLDRSEQLSLCLVLFFILINIIVFTICFAMSEEKPTKIISQEKSSANIFAIVIGGLTEDVKF